MDNLETTALVTIAIPTYNRANYLSDTIISALNQTYRNLEIIVSDNCSDDNTSEVVKSFSDSRIKYFRQQKNLGMVGNWNFCVNNASGEYLLLLSDDDLIVPSAVSELFCLLNGNEYSFVYSRVNYIDKDGKFIGKSRNSPEFELGENFILSSLSFKRDSLPSAMLVRVQDVLRVGGFADIGNAADLAMRTSLANINPVGFCSRPLVNYRLHDGSLSFELGEATRTINSFCAWAIDENNSLHRYKSYIERFCLKSKFKVLVNSIMKNNFKIDRNCLNAYGFNFCEKCLLMFLSLRIVRKVFELRRRIRV